MFLLYGCGIQNGEDARLSELHNCNLYVKKQYQTRCNNINDLLSIPDVDY